VSQRIRVAIVVACVLAVGCSDKVSHDHLDEWMQTEKGPTKLRKAVSDTSIDADLSAHAVENLVIIRDDAAAREALASLSDARKAAVLPKLAPRLWKLARIEGELTAPTDLQIAGKDMLAEIRGQADPATQTTIDGYLLDWLTGGYYEGRSPAGRWTGAQIVRMIGPSAAPSMIKAANAVVGAPEQQGKRVRVGDELLLGLAVTGDPEAVKYVLDLTGLERGDATLPERAMDALYAAYVEPPPAQFERADKAALVPHVDALAGVVSSSGASNRMVNDAVALIGAVGAPSCIAPLVKMIGQPHSDRRYVWVGANNALRCGGPAAIREVARALPTGGRYEHEAMAGSVVDPIAKMAPKEQVVAAARELLADRSWVARWVGAEVLAKVGGAEDLSKIQALSRDRARLTGYWGEGSLKNDPTLGQRVGELTKKGG